MKKFLLSACTLFVVTASVAQLPGTQTWQQKLTPATEAKAIYRFAPVAVGTDGSVISTGTFDQPITIGATQLENVATSAYLAKFNPAGQAVWAVALAGAATITSVDVDTEGNVFAAGTFAESVVVGSVDGKTQNITGMPDVTTEVAAFMVKYDAAGNLKAVRTFVPKAKTDIEGYFYEAGGVFFRPGKIQAANGRVYLSAYFTGDTKIDNVNWTGHYNGIPGVYYVEMSSAGILSFNAADLTDGKEVALLQSKEMLEENGIPVEDVNFAVDGETVYASFVSSGLQMLTTPSSVTELPLTDKDGKKEHPFILAAINADTKVKVFTTEAHDKLFTADRVKNMSVIGDKLYLAGTFYNKLGFNTEIVSQGGSDIFVACLSKGDFSVNWAKASGENEGDMNKKQEVMTGMLVQKDKVFVTGYVEDKGNRNIDANLSFNFSADGVAAAGDNGFVASSDDNSAVYAVISINDKETTLSAYKLENETSVASINALSDENGTIYGLDGKIVATDGNISALPKGVYIVKTSSTARKFIVR